MRSGRGLLEFSAGASIGALIGLSMGLSVSPIVAIIAGAIGTGLLALLNITEASGKAAAHQDTTASALRILGFGTLSVLMIAVGLLIRSHGWLSPSLVRQREELKAAGFSEVDINRVLLYRQLGDLNTAAPAAPSGSGQAARSSSPEGKPGGDAAARNAAFAASSYLFAGSADECLKIQPDQYADINAFLDSLRNRKGKYEKLAEHLSKLNKADREKTAGAIYEFLCQP